MNYCMIATGNHGYFDSLRDAPRPGRMQFVFAEIRCEIVTLYRRAVEGAGPYVDIRRTPTNYNLTDSTKEENHMKKRIFISLLALCMLLSAFCPAVYATETEDPVDTTEATEIVRAPDECGEGIKWSFDGGVLTITGDGKMDDFSEGAPWASHKDAIEEVVLDGDITYIGAYAFKDCDGILSVEFGDALYEVGKEAFASCDGLTSIWLPASFKIFGEGSFQNCGNLEEIHSEGRFPSFKQNCLWGTYCSIYFPAERPWGTEYILQLEEAFNGRIQFLASDGTDPVTGTEPETEPVTEPPTEAPTEMPTEAPTEAPTQAPTEQIPEETLVTEPETAPEPTETVPVAEEGKSSGGWIGLVIVVLVLCLIVLGAMIFGGRRRKGKYSARRRR